MVAQRHAFDDLPALARRSLDARVSLRNEVRGTGTRMAIRSVTASSRGYKAHHSIAAGFEVFQSFLQDVVVGTVEAELRWNVLVGGDAVVFDHFHDVGIGNPP